MVSDSAMVVSAHPLASEVGINILKKGGNAVDAAIAVQFALAVVYPNAGNIGGGGFMVYRSSEGEIATLDYREKAPSAATKDMYLDEKGEPIQNKSIYGALAAGVPGSVDGMTKAFDRYSKLQDWAALVQPAINLARNGYPASENEAQNLNSHQEKFNQYNHHKTAFQKSIWNPGDLILQPELSQTLELIRDQGRKGFYEGKVADLIVAEMQKSGGIITKEDLSNYQSVWREPLTTDYRGYKVIMMPPPSSGGIALAQLLEMVEPYPLSEMKFQNAAAVHLIVEAARRVYADRAKHLGDPDFYPVPVRMLMDSSYIALRMSDFNIRKASLSDSSMAGVIESEQTTHFSILDKYGNAVSLTTTLNGRYGAHTIVQGAGFILNNEMDDLSVKPGSPNMYGLIGAEANKIEPNKRMLSSMTPTIVEKNGKAVLVVGTIGGSTIITSVFQIIINYLDFGMSLNEAVQRPRFHHQWKPDVIYVEANAIKPEDRKILQIIGHKIEEREPIGRVEAIAVKNGKIYGAADHRGDDDAKGY